jgi:acetate kinase
VRVLVVNAGSSTLKLSLLDNDELLGTRTLPAPRPAADDEELANAISALGSPDVIGHRIVHGGRRFTRATPLDSEVIAALDDLTELAPLHQPKSLMALNATRKLLPDVPAVACFDTAFHAAMPPAAATYALPQEWRERWGLRRYGFHGLSHAYVSRRVLKLTGEAGPGLRVVSCHLGAGASLSAIRDGMSLDTTMGFTPLEGLVMATRSGSVDPGLLLWLLERERLSEAELAAKLEHESGLLGLAGSGDMRDVLAAEQRGTEQAQLAIATYLHRLRAGIAAMAASLGGLDVLVFTGGVGENATAIRARATAGLTFLGVTIDQDANSAGGHDRELTADGSSVRTFVIRAREDLEIARQVRATIRELEHGEDQQGADRYSNQTQCDASQE